MKWKTYNGDLVDLNDISHQHLSNILWYYEIVCDRPMTDPLMREVVKFLPKFGSYRLSYRPDPGFSHEIEALEKLGCLKRLKTHIEIWWRGRQVGEIRNPLIKEDPKMIVTSENVKVGDRVVRGPGWRFMSQDCDKHGFQTKGTVTGLTTSGWINVKWDGGKSDNYPTGGSLAFDSSTKKDTMGNIIVTRSIVHEGMRVRRGPTWVYGNQDMDSTGKETPGTITQVASTYVKVKWDGKGNEHYYYIDGHHSDLYFYDGPSTSTAAKKSTAGAPYGPTSGSTDPYKQLSNYRDVKVGDIVKCVNTDYYYGVESGLVIGQEYTVTNNNEGTLDIAGNTYCIGIGNFALLMPNPSKRPTRIPNTGTVDWTGCTHLLSKGVSLKCVYQDSYCRYEGINVGDVIQAAAVNSTKNAIQKTLGGYWIEIGRFDLAIGSGAINMSSIYSQIKSNKDESDRNISSANRSIQVQRPVAAIRHTERGAGRGLCCGRSKATIAK